jgi:hypothetical protein
LFVFSLLDFSVSLEVQTRLIHVPGLIPVHKNDLERATQKIKIESRTIQQSSSNGIQHSQSQASPYEIGRQSARARTPSGAV